MRACEPPRWGQLRGFQARGFVSPRLPPVDRGVPQRLLYVAGKSDVESIRTVSDEEQTGRWCP
eukprot:COSAG06_NODE_28376_length_575_cov_1.659664_1_plen_62_part_10